MKWQYSLSLMTLFLIAGLFFMSDKFNENILDDEMTVVDMTWKNPNDHRSYELVTLDNKLEVFLVSDPSFNKSAASMDVGVGSLADPQEHLGLAHFLEHMLFLGTEKYPDIEEYNSYLHSFQGSSNAYTAAENTNYHFEINHQGFKGALDRFAQFFISPTFNEEFVSRERNAVHSEHQKNLKDDYWRSRMVLRSLHKEGHPRQKFSTGDLETLGKTNRSTLVEFHKEHYSANNMKLVLMSKYSMEEMKAWVQEYFSEIKNTERKKLEYDSEIFAAKDLPRWVHIKPVKNLKKLTLQFATPSKEKYWNTKPASTISHLIGHEGKGSLLSLLKKEDLATGLGAWLESTSYAGMFQFDLTLTDKGVENKDRVVELFFSYINMLKDQGYKKYIFTERKVMADINYVYRDLNEGSDLAVFYASHMHQFPALEIDKREMLVKDYSVNDFNLFLSAISPSKLNAVLSYENIETDKKETHYGTEYKTLAIDDKLVSSWEKVKIEQSLALPEKNTFIPRKLEVIETKEESKPYKLIDNEWGVFWFQKDSIFKLPKANVQLLLFNKKTNESAKSKLLSLLYTMSLNEGLNEWNYDISLAGLHYSVSRADRGIQIDVSGYSENIPYLLKSLVEKLQTINIDEKRFASLKDDLKRNLDNTRLDVAYQQLIYELKYLSSKHLIHRDDIYDPSKNIDLISDISLDDVKKFTSELYTSMAIEGAAYGNLKPEPLKESIESFYKKTGSKLLALNERHEDKTIKFPKGEPKTKVIVSESHNNCWGSVMQFGARNPALNAAMRVGHAHLKTSFFTELRTKQQLGYIVHSGLNNHEKVLGMLFLIQSSEYDPIQIANRVYDWRKHALEELKSLSQEQMDLYKKAVASELREKDKTMPEKHQTMIFETLVLKGIEDYKEKIAREVEHLDLEKVLETYTRVFKDSEETSLSVYLSGKSKELSSKPRESIIEDSEEYKKASKYY